MKKRGALKKIFSVVLIVILLISSGTNIADAEEQGSTLLENSFLLTIEDENGNNEVFDESKNEINLEKDLNCSLKIVVIPQIQDKFYQYELVKNDGVQEVVIQEYSDNSNFDIVCDQEGYFEYIINVKDEEDIVSTKAVCISVIDKKGSEITEEETNSEESNSKDLESVIDIQGTLECSVSETIYEGREIILTADIVEGNGEYEYQFSEEYNGQTKILKEYCSDNTYMIDKVIGIGTHTYYVNIRDAKEKTLELSRTIEVQSGKSLQSNEKIKMTFLGDSLTARNDWASMYPEYEVNNMGVGSDTTGKMLQRIDSVIEVKPDKIFIMGGINDLTQGIETAEIVQNMQTIIKKLQKDMSVSDIFIQSILPTGESYVKNSKVEEVNTALENLCRSENVNFINLYPEFCDSKVIKKELYYGDGVHLRAEGYNVWKEKIDIALAGGSVETTELKGTLTSNPTSPVYEQRTVTLTAEISSGNGGYEYQFTEVYNGKKNIVKSYSGENSYTVNGIKGVGVHTYYVDVRDAKGKTLQLSYAMEVREYPAQELKGTLTSNQTSPVYAERNIVLTANVLSGNGGYKYQFEEVYGNTDRKVVQKFSENNIYTFNSDKIGEYVYYVTIKDSKGKEIELSYKLEVVGHPAYKLSGKVTNSASNYEYVDRSMYLTAEAEGGYGEYQYQFEEEYQGIRKVVQKYSKNNVYSFRTDTIGIHDYYVIIKDAKEQKITLKYSIQVIGHPAKQMTGTLNSSVTSPVYSSRDVVLTANVTNGYGGYEYQFIQIFEGERKIVQEYSETNTYSFRTKMPGMYTYSVNIKDKANAVLTLSYNLNVVSNGTFDKGIDVSAWQGYVDWSKVKQSDVDFAMLRILSGTMDNLTIDSQFYNNIANASNNGISVGVYRYGYAESVDEARREAQMVVNALKSSGYDISYPVAYDVEDIETQGPENLSKTELTNIIKAFKQVIESNGYQFMIYANKNWLENIIDMKQFSQEDVWIAQYRDYTPDLGYQYSGPGNVTIWQYSSRGSVQGISGNVDMNIGYYRY